ncbi:anaerobic ribonucleoside-triphosphate reductase activating protein [Chakrabartyella piscis]|uniref:anaerobic ribonucleoside-triphosphate reductase activating protein n=1 Tax=Chakrabartyella piscis TaxID=2918914 RepID=UPI002958D816|nr:anaerobic ribonucleoside-triphosphate reductase activating protein [Chakrabartyella piscis]
MEIRLSGITNDSIVDGMGIRLTVFTQGCTHHCKNCHNPQTHDPNGGYLKDTDTIVEMLAENPLLDGVTLSGGEPFLQVDACTELAKQAHGLGLNVWAYTGFVWEDLLGTEKETLLKEVDVLVDGLFVESLKSLDLLFCGSSNQRLIDVKESFAKSTVVLWK